MHARCFGFFPEKFVSLVIEVFAIQTQEDLVYKLMRQFFSKPPKNPELLQSYFLIDTILLANQFHFN
jgi:hypothetical protein